MMSLMAVEGHMVKMIEYEDETDMTTETETEEEVGKSNR